MKNLIEQLERLDCAVPDSSELVDAVMRRLPNLPRRRRLTQMRLAIGALAASVLIVVPATVIFMTSTPSPEEAFGEVVQRVARFDSVRYWVREERNNSPDDYQNTSSVGGRWRADFPSSKNMTPEVIIHNQQTWPDVDLRLYLDRKVAEFSLDDADRERAVRPDNPVTELQDFAAENGMTSAPDAMYRGRTVRVFVRKPGSPKHGNTTRVLVDKETGMPLRIEMRASDGQGIISHWALEDFEWNPRIDDSTYSVQPPAGYKVVYNLMRALAFGLEAYAGRFDERLPDHVDSATLNMFMQKVEKEEQDSWSLSNNADADWGFRVPAFAAAHKIDFRYYGAGQRFDQKKPGKIVAAIETAPGSGFYDVLMSDFSRDQLHRSQLP